MKTERPNIEIEPDQIATTRSTEHASDEVVTTEPVSSAAPAIPPPAAEAKFGGLGWLLRVGVNAAAILVVAAMILVMIGFAQRSEWITANGFFGGGEGEAVADAGAGQEKRYICPMMCTPPSTRARSLSRVCNGTRRSNRRRWWRWHFSDD